MNPTQLFAILSPFILGAATLLVHYLSPATVSEVGTILGLVVTMLVGVRNVFVPAPPSSASKSRTPPNLPVLFMGICCAIAIAWTFLIMACTPAAQAFALTAEQDACELLVMGSSTIPIGTDPAQVANDVKLACNLADQATPYLISAITAFEANQAPPPTGVYRPSPLVLAKRGIVIVERVK
jgi:hypothetical protein